MQPMTVKELRKLLKQCPGDLIVYVKTYEYSSGSTSILEVDKVIIPDTPFTESTAVIIDLI